MKGEETMKKIFSILVAILLLLSLSMGVSATSYTYKDAETDVSFTVPDNWTQKALSKDREYIDVKFVSNVAEGMSILYGSTDVWAKMPSSDRAGYKRSDLNNSMFTNADIAEMAGTSTSKVKRVSYNGVQCFQAESTTTSDIYGLEISVTMTHVIYYDNGWMYWFQFSGDSNNEYFSDFKAMLNTVTFPQTDTENDVVGTILTVVCILAVIAGVVFLVVKKDRYKAKTTPIACVANEHQENEPNETSCQYCRKCGTKMEMDSVFCHNCGTKTISEEDIQ